jgi:hypothetical protein
VTAYLVAGATVSALGPRGAVGVAAGGTVAVLLYSAFALRRAPDPTPPDPADEARPASLV